MYFSLLDQSFLTLRPQSTFRTTTYASTRNSQDFTRDGSVVSRCVLTICANLQSVLPYGNEHAYTDPVSHTAYSADLLSIHPTCWSLFCNWLSLSSLQIVRTVAPHWKLFFIVRGSATNSSTASGRDREWKRERESCLPTFPFAA